MRELYGSEPAADFGPLALRAVQQRMIQLDWSRRVINQQIGRIRQVFKWAVARELLLASVLQALQTVAPLRAGRSEARETEPVRPVDDRAVLPVKPYVSRQVWALIRLQQLTGAPFSPESSLRSTWKHR